MNRHKVIAALTHVVSDNGIAEIVDKQAVVVAEYLMRSLEQLIWVSSQPSALMFKIESPTAEEQREAKKEENDDVNKFVDEMYEIYPTKCPKRNSSLGKSRKDKDRIRKLLKTYSKEEIEQVIRNEVDSNYGVNYMKNFSTFLNNFPEPNDESTKATPSVCSSSDRIFVNGVEYR